MFHGRTLKEHLFRQDNFEAWCEQLGPQSQPIKLAKLWSRAMEVLIAEQSMQVTSVAGLTLAHVGGQQMSARTVRLAVLVLVSSWEFGMSLLAWAKKQGLVEQEN